MLLLDPAVCARLDAIEPHAFPVAADDFEDLLHALQTLQCAAAATLDASGGCVSGTGDRRAHRPGASTHVACCMFDVACCMLHV
jgi:hypothetical protein